MDAYNMYILLLIVRNPLSESIVCNELVINVQKRSWRPGRVWRPTYHPVIGEPMCTICAFFMHSRNKKNIIVTNSFTTFYFKGSLFVLSNFVINALSSGYIHFLMIILIFWYFISTIFHFLHEFSRFLITWERGLIISFTNNKMKVKKISTSRSSSDFSLLCCIKFYGSADVFLHLRENHSNRTL